LASAGINEPLFSISSDNGGSSGYRTSRLSPRASKSSAIQLSVWAIGLGILVDEPVGENAPI